MPSRLWMSLTAKRCSREVFGECNLLNPSLGEGCAVSVFSRRAPPTQRQRRRIKNAY
jgi:hypothetical protein